MDDQDAIYAMLTELISRTTERDQIVVADTPLDALGLDSLGLIEVIFELEERYNVDLPFNANEMAQNSHQATVGNIVDMVVRARAGVDSKLGGSLSPAWASFRRLETARRRRGKRSGWGGPVTRPAPIAGFISRWARSIAGVAPMLLFSRQGRSTRRSKWRWKRAAKR